MSEDWAQYEKFVISSLERIERRQEQMNEEIITLKTKAAVWGSVAAFLVSGAVQVIAAMVK